MGPTIADINPSLDGFVARLCVSVEAPFGTVRKGLTRWNGWDGTEPSRIDRQASQQLPAATGSFVTGRTQFDVDIGVRVEDVAWERPAWRVAGRPGGDLARGPACSYSSPRVEAAMEQAETTAGERTVVIAEGASNVQQARTTGLVDELRLHVLPELSRTGIRISTKPTSTRPSNPSQPCLAPALSA
jgi:hypothetical protein